MSPIIRPMLDSDWDEVCRIYVEGIETGQATFQTDAPSQQAWGDGHLDFARLVAVADGAIVGWAALSPVSRRPVYRGVCEVSVYVASSARGCGIGSILMAALIEFSEQGGVWMLQSSIFPENQASLRLHRRFGFRIVGTREKIGQLAGEWRDTVLMERRSQRVGIG